MSACRFCVHACGFGGKGIRTPGLLIANETLYQLSYTPAVRWRTKINTPREFFIKRTLACIRRPKSLASFAALI